MIIVLTREAEHDLEQIGDYIALDNPHRALSFVRELRERPGLEDLPVIVITGDPRLSVSNTGAQAVLHKPVDRERLAGAVARWLAHASARA